MLSVFESFSCCGLMEKSIVNKTPFSTIEIRNAIAICQSCRVGFTMIASQSRNADFLPRASCTIA